MVETLITNDIGSALLKQFAGPMISEAKRRIRAYVVRACIITGIGTSAVLAVCSYYGVPSFAWPAVMGAAGAGLCMVIMHD